MSLTYLLFAVKGRDAEGLIPGFPNSSVLHFGKCFVFLANIFLLCAKSEAGKSNSLASFEKSFLPFPRRRFYGHNGHTTFKIITYIISFGYCG